MKKYYWLWSILVVACAIASIIIISFLLRTLIIQDVFLSFIQDASNSFHIGRALWVTLIVLLAGIYVFFYRHRFFRSQSNQ